MKRKRIKLKKKTRKQLKRLARAVGGLGAVFATELLAQMTSSFLAERPGNAGRARPRDESERGGPRPARDRVAWDDHHPLPRTADQH